MPLESSPSQKDSLWLFSSHLCCRITSSSWLDLFVLTVGKCLLKLSCAFAGKVSQGKSGRGFLLFFLGGEGIFPKALNNFCYNRFIRGKKHRISDPGAFAFSRCLLCTRIIRMKTATANSVAKVHQEPNLKPPNPSSCLAFAIIGHQQRNEAVALSLHPGWQLDFLLSPQAAAAQHDGAVNLCISWCLSGGRERRVSGEGNGACPSLGSTCLHWRHRALLISVQVSKCSPRMTAWHSQHPHSVTGAGSRSHCLPLMSMSLMEMEESEGHISIQIASILSAIQPPGSGGCRFPSAAPLTHFHRIIPIAYKYPPCGSGPMTLTPLPYTNMFFSIIWLAKNKVGVLLFLPALWITKVSLVNTCYLQHRKWKLLLFKLEASSMGLMHCLQWSYQVPSKYWCLSVWSASW